MNKKFVVSYELDYVHRVMVGVTAEDAEAAKNIAAAAFDAGTIWDDTEEMPLLFDDYEEVEGNTLRFCAEAVADFPAPESSVAEIKRRAAAEATCRVLIEAYRKGGDSVAWEDIDRAYEMALKAHPTR